MVAGYDQVAAARLREGVANDARGAKGFVVETIGRVRAAGAQGSSRCATCSGFFSQAVIDACRDADARFSITVRMNPYLQQAIDKIPADAWTAIPDWALRDGVAEVAETRIPAFKDDPVPVRGDRAPGHSQSGQGRGAARAAARLALPGAGHRHRRPAVAGRGVHRDHAAVEATIKELKYHCGLAHLPWGRFAANAAWLGLVVLAYNLGRPTLLAGKGIDCFCSTKTLRKTLVAWPARIARSGRKVVLHGLEGWPWAKQVTAALGRLRAVPAPA